MKAFVLEVVPGPNARPVGRRCADSDASTTAIYAWYSAPSAEPSSRSLDGPEESDP